LSRWEVYRTWAQESGHHVEERASTQGSFAVGASDRTALPGTAGGAARLVPPEEVAAAVRALLGDETEKQRLRAAGIRRAASFSWERTAREVDALVSARVAAPPADRRRATAR